jgi:hypothetical protein
MDLEDLDRITGNGKSGAEKCDPPTHGHGNRAAADPWGTPIIDWAGAGELICWEQFRLESFSQYRRLEPRHG